MDGEELMTLVQLTLLLLGIKELFAAKEYYGQQKKKWAVASACMGIFGCVCAIVSFTGIL